MAQCSIARERMALSLLFPFSGAVLDAFRASLAPSDPLVGGLPLHVRSNAAHLAIDESAQNNYERRCIRLKNLP